MGSGTATIAGEWQERPIRQKTCGTSPRHISMENPRTLRVLLTSVNWKNNTESQILQLITIRESGDMECKCGRDKENRGAAFNCIGCDECEHDMKLLRPETSNFTKDDWVAYAKLQYWNGLGMPEPVKNIQ